MFLSLSHRKLDVYHESQNLVRECYRITASFPSDEKFGMCQQIRRAALSALLNLAEGSSRRSQTERRRFYEISRGSIVEIDACFDVAVELNYVRSDELNRVGLSITRTFQMISKLMSGLEEKKD
jgi:four helix bundle protein